MKKHNNLAYYLSSFLAGLALIVGLALLERPQNPVFHAGYAGAFWMLLPLFLAPILLPLAGKYFSPKTTADKTTTLNYLKSAFLCSLLAQAGLLIYTVLFAPACFGRVLLGALCFLLSAAILTLIAAFLRRSTANWLSWVFMSAATLLGTIRGVVYVITGNMGGTIGTLGELLVRLSPPLARIAFLAKDAASGYPIQPMRLILPAVYLFALVSLFAARNAQTARLKRLALALAAFSLLIFAPTFSTRTIDPTTMQAFEKAMEITDGGALWPGFEMREIQFAVRDGKGEIYFSDTSPAAYGPETIEVLAYTATLEDGQATLHVLPFEDTRALYDPFGLNRPELTFEQYVSVIAHEAFHAFQFTQLGDPQQNDSLGQMLAFQSLGASLNADPAYNELWSKELNAAWATLAAHEDLNHYLAARSARESYEKNKLSAEEFEVYQNSQALMERIEGTARYIELKSMPGDFRQNSLYRQLTSSPGGSERYYTSGMGRALLLDLTAPNWKDSYTFTENLNLE